MDVVTVDRHESALGVWTSTVWRPAPGTVLEGAVDRIWHFDGTLNAARERIFPDNTLELIVQLDTPHRPGIDVPAEHFPALCVTGLRTTAEVVEAPADRCRVLGVILAPTAAFALLRCALPGYTARTVDMHDVIGSAAQELATCVHDARDGRVAVRAAAAWAAQRLAHGRGSDATVERALAAILADGGTRSIAALDAWRGHSRARFTAAFRDQVGVSPKRLARIARFHRALEVLKRGQGVLGDAALAAGYYDQAHFTSEFREHAGMTPTAYLRALRFPGGRNLVDTPEQYFQDAVAVVG
jgi:AraC-like DNA-binding protein